MGRYQSVKYRVIKPFICFFILLTALISSACQFPNDANDTLNNVKDGVLKVGVTENPPWVIRTDSGAEGVEAEIILVFADSLNAKVEWHWGTETELLQALSQHQVHVVMGGLTQQSPKTKGIVHTEPYFKTRITIGFPHAQDKTTDIDEVKVALPVVNQYSQALESRGAIPEPMENLNNLNMPVANAVWWLRAKGYEPGPWDLFTETHVMAVTEGENAFLQKLQQHIDEFSAVEAKLETWARQSKD